MRLPEDELAALKSASLLRHIPDVDSSLKNFSSNDYLGLSQHPEIKQAYHEAIEKYGAGSTASRLICGTMEPHTNLEETIATAKGTEAALTFSTGYATSVGTITSLLGKGDIVILDKLCHASLIDGARMSGATLRVFPHNHLEKLESLLQSSTTKADANSRILVITESIFSMDGDSHDLFSAALSAHTYNALLWVDDCHGVGVMGDKGRGVLDTMTLSEAEVPILSGTFGKAFGTSGAYVAGSNDLIETLIQKARTYKYNTALPVPVVAATLKSLEIIQSEPWRREKILELIHIYKQGCKKYGLAEQAKFTDSPIQPILLKTEAAALEKSAYLKQCGIITTAIRPPTVPKNQCRLRITLNTELEREDIDVLIQCLIGNY